LAVLAKLFERRGALVVVQPATMMRWHRAGWRLLWGLSSTADSSGTPEADSQDGQEESAVGRRADRQRTAAQVEHSDLAKDGRPLAVCYTANVIRADWALCLLLLDVRATPSLSVGLDSKHYDL
jgi:hypothetical protein